MKFEILPLSLCLVLLMARTMSSAVHEAEHLRHQHARGYRPVTQALVDSDSTSFNCWDVEATEGIHFSGICTVTWINVFDGGVGALADTSDHGSSHSATGPLSTSAPSPHTLESPD